MEINLDPGLLLVVAAFGLIVGAILGIGLMILLTSGANAKNSDRLEVLFRLLRDRKQGKTVLEMDGEVYHEVAQMRVGVYRALIQHIRNLEIWMGEGMEEMPDKIPPTVQTVQAIDKNPAETFEALEIEEAPIENTSDDRVFIKQEEPAIMLPDDTVASIANKKPILSAPKVKSSEDTATKEKKGGLFGNFSRVFGKSKGDASQNPTSLVAQIDEILQEKLADEPKINNSIRLVEIPDGGMIVMVDDRSYEGVGEIPDPVVRDIIQDSVDEWERRNAG